MRLTEEIAKRAETDARAFLDALSQQVEKPFGVTSDHVLALQRLILESIAKVETPP